jgi:hypothetical protein
MSTLNKAKFAEKYGTDAMKSKHDESTWKEQVDGVGKNASNIATLPMRHLRTVFNKYKSEDPFVAKLAADHFNRMAQRGCKE